MDKFEAFWVFTIFFALAIITTMVFFPTQNTSVTVNNSQSCYSYKEPFCEYETDAKYYSGYSEPIRWFNG